MGVRGKLSSSISSRVRLTNWAHMSLSSWTQAMTASLRVVIIYHVSDHHRPKTVSTPHGEDDGSAPLPA